MLKMYGTINGITPEDIDIVANDLKSLGYEIAYQNAYSSAIIKEVPDPNQDDENA